MPRAMLCCATLCGTVLEAAVKQAAVLAAAAAGISAQQPLDLSHGLGPLSPADVQPVCDLVLQVLLAHHDCLCCLLCFRNIGYHYVLADPTFSLILTLLYSPSGI